MSAIKTYKGGEVNLKHYQDESVVDYWFDIMEDDGSDTDLTQYSNIKFQIFAKRKGTLIKTFDYNSGLSVGGSRVTFNAAKLYTSLFRQGLTYYHNMIGIRKLPIGETDVIFFGNSEMI